MAEKNETNDKKKNGETIKIKVSTLLFLFGAVVVIALVIGGYFLLKGNGTGAATTDDTVETFDLEVATVLAPASCAECYNASMIVDYLKQVPGATVSKEYSFASDSKEGKSLIEKYGITMLPAIIIKGDVSKADLPGFALNGNALIYNETTPPYYDIATEKVKGLVSVKILVDEECTQCSNLSRTVEALKMYGVGITKEETIDYSSNEGKALVKQYGITKIPSLIFSEDAGVYALISSVWDNVGTVEKDGSYIMRNVTPPYKDLESGKIAGLVDLTLLTDSSCEACYNVTMHEQILQFNFGMAFSDKKIVDVNDDDGKELVEKYNITAVPTMILSGDVDAYASLKQAWPTVGTIEDDGTYVFRQLDALSGVTYKDLATGTEKTTQSQEAEVTQ